MSRRTLLPLALAAALVLPAAATADPVVGPAIPLAVTPDHVVADPDGSAWVTTTSAPGTDLLHVLADGTVTPFDLPGDGTVGITFGPDGALWATRTGAVLRIPPAAPATAQAFPVADITDARGIVTGPDGNLWTGSGAKLIRITPAGVATSFPTGANQARDIAATPTGLALADLGGELVRATTDGTVTRTPVGDGAQAVAAAPSGQIAVTAPGAAPSRVTLLGPDHLVPVANDPFGVTYAADGAFWVARFAADALERVAPDGTSTTLPLGAGAGPRFIATGPNGRLWVTADVAKTVRRIDGVSAPAPDPTPTTPSPTTPPPGVDPVVVPKALTLFVKPVPRKVRRTALFRVRTSLDATATVTLKQRRTGRRNRRGTCVRPTAAPRGRACLRFSTRKTKRVSLQADTWRVVKFPKLTPGVYRVEVVARSAGLRRTRTSKIQRVR